MRSACSARSAFAIEPQADGTLCAQAELPRADAADLAARLRGIGLDGEPLVCEVTPRLDAQRGASGAAE